MKDRFPTEIEFDIDRRQLLRYWRVQSFIGCCVPIILLFAFIGIGFYKIHLDSIQDIGIVSIVVWLVLYIVAVILAGLIVGGIIYLALCHMPSRRAAANLRLLVEGPFLRIVSGAFYVTDRRIHFRAISDYSTHEGPLLKKFGMKSLSFRVIGSGQNPSEHIVGLVDPDDVRDQLCEIDAARENAE
ncbi:MAG: hypothetical protein JXM70_16595 [Pirellulales bacterium]|nr:hypothetical protein [Pirellulales bacterium]